MTQQYIDNDGYKNMVCNAFGCTAAVITAQEVKVGTLGVITLFLCNECVKEFKDDI